MGLVQYNGQDLMTSRVFFTGTTALRKGQVLCYQETTGGTTKGLGMDVEEISSDNINFFAGIPSLSDVGKTGPAYIDMIVPQRGNFLDIEADGTQDIAIAAVLELDATLGGLIAGGTSAVTDPLLVIALEAFTTDATLSAIKVFIK